MNIVIVGVGSVGFTAAQVLMDSNNLLLIEKDKGVTETVESLLNVSVYNEDGANPTKLAAAIERINAEAVISTTMEDHVNVFISMMSKRIKPSIKTVARIRSPEFMVPEIKNDVDQIISPELITASKISELALLENAVDFEAIESMEMVLAIFEVKDDNIPVIGKVVINLDIPNDSTVVAIYRNDDVILNNETTEIHIGDKICVLGSPDGIREFNKMMGIAREAGEFIIIGGGITGVHIAKILEAKKKYVKLFESNLKKSKELSKIFNSVITVYGSGVDPHLLKSESVGRADVLMATTNADESNLLSCLMARKLGTTKVISRYSMKEYEEIFDYTGVSTTVGHHRIVANEVTKTLVSDEKAILRMKREEELFFSVNVEPRSKIGGQHLGDVRMPDGARVACIIRDGQKIYPRMDTVFNIGDKVLLFTYMADQGKIGKLFGTKIEI